MEQKRIDGFTEEQLKVALLLYTTKVKADIFHEVHMEEGIDLTDTEDESLLEIFNTLMDKAFTAGMEAAADRWKIKDYYQQITSIKVTIPLDDQWEFEEHKGISGVLLADGTFLKCGNGQHHLLVEDFPFEAKARCLYFSSQMRYADDGVVSNSPVGFKGMTVAQITWMEKHRQFLDYGQDIMYHQKYTEEVKG